MPPHLKKSKNQAHFKNGTYGQIVTHLKNELELKCLEAPDELQINTVNHNTVLAKADKPNLTFHHCKKSGIYRNQCRLLKKSENKLKTFKILLETKTVTPILVNRSATPTIKTTTTKTALEPKESQKLFIHPVRNVARQTIPQRIAIMEPM